MERTRRVEGMREGAAVKVTGPPTGRRRYEWRLAGDWRRVSGGKFVGFLGIERGVDKIDKIHGTWSAAENDKRSLPAGRAQRVN